MVYFSWLWGIGTHVSRGAWLRPLLGLFGFRVYYIGVCVRLWGSCDIYVELGMVV